MENNNDKIKGIILGESCTRIMKLEPTKRIYTRIVRKFQRFFLWERKQVLAYVSPIELYMTLLKKNLLPFEDNIIRQIHISRALGWIVIIKSHPEHKTNEIVCDVCFYFQGKLEYRIRQQLSILENEAKLSSCLIGNLSFLHTLLWNPLNAFPRGYKVLL
jgi:hypothetical protein